MFEALDYLARDVERAKTALTVGPVGDRPQAPAVPSKSDPLADARWSTDSGRHPTCLVRLQDFRGAAGLPVYDIHLNQVARVMLTGDLVFDGQGVTAQIRRCDEFQAWSADFLKKTWQPFKPVDGQTRNTCEFDGDPRPMEQVACRSGDMRGAHWGFTDPSGRWVQVSACVPAMTTQN